MLLFNKKDAFSISRTFVWKRRRRGQFGGMGDVWRLCTIVSRSCQSVKSTNTPLPHLCSIKGCRSCENTTNSYQFSKRAINKGHVIGGVITTYVIYECRLIINQAWRSTIHIRWVVNSGERGWGRKQRRVLWKEVNKTRAVVVLLLGTQLHGGKCRPKCETWIKEEQ